MTHGYHNEGRFVAALFCLLAFAVAVAEPAISQPVPLRMVAWDDPGTRGLSLTADLLAGFHDRCPGVRVSYSHEDRANLRVRLRYWMGSHQQYAPDLTVLPDVYLSAHAGQLLPLDEALKPRDTDAFVPALLDRCRVNGKLVGVPWIVQSRALYYRPDLLEAARLSPPQTLSDLKRAAEKLSRRQSVYGLGLPGASAAGGLEMFLDLLHGHDGRLQDDKGQFDFQSPAAIDALEYWVSLQQAGATQPEALSWTQAELQEAFVQGKLAMLIAGPALHQRLREAAPALPVAVAPLPADRQPALPVSAEVLVALKTTAQPQAAAEFLRFMCRPEAQLAMSYMGSLPTIRAQLRKVREEPGVAPFVAGLEQARGLPMREIETAERVVGRALWLALSGRMDAETALKTAAEEEARRIF